MRFPLAFLVLILYPALSVASLDFCVDPEEQKRLIGVSGELCYVKDGKTNQYALETFTIPVKASIDTLQFTWQNKHPVLHAQYILRVTYEPSDSANKALGEWSSSLGRSGEVPVTRKNFTVTIPCTGKLTAEINVIIQMSISTGDSNLYDLKLKRKKICLQKAPEGEPGDDSSKPSDKISREDAYLNTIEARNTAPLSNSTKLIAIIVTCVVCLVVVGLTVFLTMRKGKNKTHNGHPDPSIVLEVLIPAAPSLVMSGNHEEGNHIAGSVYHDHRSSASPKQSLLGPHYDYGTSQCDTALHPPTSILAPDQNQFDNIIAELAIDSSLVEIHDTIASGTFSMIQLGVYHVDYPETEQTHAVEVRIKTLKPGALDDQISVMFQDGVMFYGLQHVNINELLGCVYDPPAQLSMLLYTGARHENLRNLLGSVAPLHFAELHELVFLALQALNGIQYLHSCNIVHKDIAARNCLVSLDLKNLQITDAALSRDLFPDDYQCLGDNYNRPIKWMAYESLVRYDFSTASDVWGFGMLLWELLSFGVQPFLEVDAFEMTVALKEGLRMVIPPGCPQILYDQMTKCWIFYPEGRPTIAELIESISLFHALIEGYA